MNLSLPSPLWRRLIAGVYDILLLAGLWMFAGWILVVSFSILEVPVSRHLNQSIYFLIGFGFYGWFWTHGGQTLGMRVWRLQVRRSDGGTVRWPIALLRYSAAWVSAFAIGLGFLWSLFDGQRRTWHDMLSGTELIVVERQSAQASSDSA